MYFNLFEGQPVKELHPPREHLIPLRKLWRLLKSIRTAWRTDQNGVHRRQEEQSNLPTWPSHMLTRRLTSSYAIYFVNQDFGSVVKKRFCTCVNFLPFGGPKTILLDVIIMPQIVCTSWLHLRSGLLKLWVANHKWVPEPSHVDRENASCKNIIMVITSVSLPINISRSLFY